uniref:HTH La-type RNA-binding domain-containing protein n=1 Tax=Angiostrongylus cantonensis TaxID=6313 RepID=A0A0K0CV44_ANGCA
VFNLGRPESPLTGKSDFYFYQSSSCSHEEFGSSRENLITDRYLRCQMDADQFVPISIIAGFRKIVQLTNDYNLILQVLRESNQVEVDERGEKVRSVCRRCTIILREISEQHRDEVEKMLSGGPPYVDLKYGLNNSWYVTFDNEETTQQAYLHLQNVNITFNNKPICVSVFVYHFHARIKAGGPPSDLPPIDRVPAQVSF